VFGIKLLFVFFGGVHPGYSFGKISWVRKGHVGACMDVDDPTDFSRVTGG